MEHIHNCKIILEDRYSDKILECHKNTVFLVGKNTVATIRKSNNSCVDIRDENGKLLNWFCLEFVLKNPKMFIPIVVCEDMQPPFYQTDVSNIPYRKLCALDKKVKPLILKWLSNLFGYKNYPNSFKDQWITWSIWDGELSVRFDLRQEEQVQLLSLIHPRFLGCLQYKTLKVVNEKTFYIPLKRLLHIEYPEIINSKMLSKDKQLGGTGGWHSASDDFYTYDWEVFLSDGSSLFYQNQKDTMDMVKDDFIYNATIQERAFVNFLQSVS